MSFGHQKHHPAKDFLIPTAGLSCLTPLVLFNGFSSFSDWNPRGGDGVSIWSPAKSISSVIGVSNTTMQGSSRFPSSLMPSTDSRPSLSYQNPCGGGGVMVVMVLRSRSLHCLCSGGMDLGMGFRFQIWAVFFRG